MNSVALPPLLYPLETMAAQSPLYMRAMVAWGMATPMLESSSDVNSQRTSLAPKLSGVVTSSA